MRLHGSVVIIICCFLLQFPNLVQKRYMLSFGNDFNNIFVICTQGLMFLVYPLLGHLAYLTRYRTLNCGLITGGITLFFWVLVTAISQLHIVIGKEEIYAIGCLFALRVTIGIGLFEANAIQYTVSFYSICYL